MTDPYADTDIWPNPPASQQPARPATLTASEASRVLGEGSDAQEARVAAYAEAIDRLFTVSPEQMRDLVPAVLAVADAELADLRAEVERLEGNLSALLCDLTGGRLSKTTYDVRTMVQAIEEYFEESTDDDGLARTASAIAAVTPCSCSAQRARAESAERARDAALAEVTGLRARLGRVEALAVEFDEVVGFRGVATALRAALAVPVTVDTEDTPRPRRYDQCDETCTTDCGHCKGAASPTEQATEGGAK